MSRVRRLKLILWSLAGLATAVACSRFAFGLGATTNLSDATPWGVWIGFDVMSGVALAAGGFIVTATVYVLRLEKFHAVVRPAVLTAFLGYVAVAAGLLFDLGLPWNIWHMIVFWNPRSALFEVGWCVMLYLTVLALEFFPVPAEEFGALGRIRSFLVRIRFPLVLVGIGLSTLHQSSLGSLYLIMPYRLHPLWYTPILPVLFLISAIGLGLLMVIFESHTTAWLYRRKPEAAVLERFGAAARWVLLAYILVRLGDIGLRGRFADLAGPDWRVGLFWAEIALSVIVPAALLSIPKIRASRAGQWTAACAGIAGVVMNRIDVGGFAHLRPNLYIPSWTEIAISAGVVAGAILTFLFFVERFRIWEERPVDPDADSRRLPEFDRVGMTWLGAPHIAGRTLYSLGFILAAAAGFALLTPQPAASRGVESSPARRARGDGDLMRIDGNLDGRGVSFPHRRHVDLNGGKASCARCHHMNLPRDQASGCYQCHREMYAVSDAFGHDWHASPAGGKLSCGQCHPKGRERVASTAKKCAECHKDLLAPGSPYRIAVYHARSYADAMHHLCIGCHRAEAVKRARADMPRCAWCHRDVGTFVDDPRLGAVAGTARRMLIPIVR